MESILNSGSGQMNTPKGVKIGSSVQGASHGRGRDRADLPPGNNRDCAHSQVVPGRRCNPE